MVREREKQMTIHYTDGKALEAVLLTRTETTIRAAVQGADDVTEYSKINGAWVSEDCEPVRIVFAWQQQKFAETVTEADCICSRELAARLIHLLFSEEAPTAPHFDSAAAPATFQLLA
jgi:hypothetical protein